jgi:hypothetical protein
MKNAILQWREQQNATERTTARNSFNAAQEHATEHRTRCMMTLSSSDIRNKHMAGRLANKVAVISGAGSGIVSSVNSGDR